MFGLIRGDVPPKPVELPKDASHSFPVFSLSPTYGVKYELQLILLLCFGSNIMDSKPLKLQAKLKTVFYKLSWSWCFITATER